MNDDFYVVGREYALQFDTTTWGWIHLILGVVILVAGLYLFTGAVLARTVGVIMAVVSAVAGFAWLPWYPVWGIVIIAIAVRCDLGTDRTWPGRRCGLATRVGRSAT